MPNNPIRVVPETDFAEIDRLTFAAQICYNMTLSGDRDPPIVSGIEAEPNAHRRPP
jgi:hypothetical protein